MRTAKQVELLVKDIMHTGDTVPKIPIEASLKEALIEMTQKNLGMTVVVQDENTIAGVFTDGDLRRLLDHGEVNLSTICIADVMIKNCKTGKEHMLASEVLAIMEKYKINALPIIDDTTHPEYGNSLISFRKAFIDEHPEAVKGFLAAVEEAVDEINSDPTRWSDLLTERQLVPAPLIGTYKIPTFPSASVPSQAQWDDVLAWAKDKGLIKSDVSYSESVDESFLP